MSEVTPKTRSAADMSSAGLPTWSGVTIVIAALLTGLGISLLRGSIGTPYLIFFVASALIVALFTEARGLFLTVASIPLSFGILTVATSWLLGRSLSPNSDAFSLTSIITAVYPSLQYFPVLAVVTVVAALIGWARIRLLNRQIAQREERLIAARRRASESNRVNLMTANRARRTTDWSGTGSGGGAGAGGGRPPRTAPAAQAADPAAAIARESRTRRSAASRSTASRGAAQKPPRMRMPRGQKTASTPQPPSPRITVEELRRREQEARQARDAQLGRAESVEKRQRRNQALNRDLYRR